MNTTMDATQADSTTMVTYCTQMNTTPTNYKHKNEQGFVKIKN